MNTRKTVARDAPVLATELGGIRFLRPAKRAVDLIAFAFAFGLSLGPALAGFDEGLAAYNTGNLAVAAKEWRTAAQSGDPRAQFRLGMMYEQGRGVVQNRVQAHVYYNLAAAEGDEEAAQARERLSKTMTADELADAERNALAWNQTPSSAILGSPQHAVPPDGSVRTEPTTSSPPVTITAQELYKAAEMGDVAKLREMIARGVNLNEADADGWTALFYATAKGRTEAVKMLIDGKADVNAKGTRNGETALMIAVLNGNPETVKALMKAGARRSDKDRKGRNAHGLADAKANQTILALFKAPLPATKSDLQLGRQKSLGASGAPSHVAIGKTPSYKGPLPGSQIDKVTRISDRVGFDFDSLALSVDAIHSLDGQAEWLIRYPAECIRVTGSASNDETSIKNGRQLGIMRANIARSYLISKGIPENRVSVSARHGSRTVTTSVNECGR